MARPNLRPQLQHRALVGEQLDQLADVVDPQAVLRDRAAQQALVGARPVGQRALEVGRGTAWRPRTASASSSTSDVDDAVGLPAP